ncbi:tetraspanin-6 [Aplysia californica]|uniref:Tetraspanin-6 n=1 Tax=Aplysia californica TaxID=6500 RepID=A0ABM0JW54_APLCA|nr:tetraspanin-6 [Aplysia californica]
MGLLNCFKILLYIFNIVFIAVGLTLIGIGIWTAVTKVYVSFVIGDTLFSAASYMLIGVGVVLITVCIIGICGLMKADTRWLLIYFGFLIFCFIILLTAAILAIVFRSEVENVMADNMRKSLVKSYAKDKEITDAWDQLQKDLQCCAISRTPITSTSGMQFQYVDDTYPIQAEIEYQDSWPIYKRTEFYRRQLNVGPQQRKYVPVSCCVYDNTLEDFLNKDVCQYFPNGPPYNYELMLTNRYVNYEGCYEKAKALVLNQSDIIVAIGFVFGFIMIAGMVLTFLLVRWMTTEADEISRRRRPDNL